MCPPAHLFLHDLFARSLIFSVCWQATEFDGLDTRFYKQDLDHRLRLDENLIRDEYARSEQDKLRRESVSHFDDFFEPALSQPLSHHNSRYHHQSHMPYLAAKNSMHTINDGPKLGVWDEIESSIQKLDPENVEMIGSLAAAAAINTTMTQIKIEVPDEPTSSDTYHNHSLVQPITVKSEKLPPLHSPSPTLQQQLMQSSTVPNGPYSSSCHSIVPQQYHNHNHNSYKSNLYSIPPRIMYPVSVSADADSNSVNSVPRRTPPPPYPIPSATPVSRTTQKYNRRNNPELEKRRIHHCNYLSKSSLLVFLFTENIFQKRCDF